ncbi:MAG: hypothetical protein NTY19_41435 [Planctomycetota bacterium]|nr:hypothetical protein [Planctomycetota bacterium]
MSKKVMAIVGVILIVAGALALFYRGIPYTSRDVVVDVIAQDFQTDDELVGPRSSVVGHSPFVILSADASIREWDRHGNPSQKAEQRLAGVGVLVTQISNPSPRRSSSWSICSSTRMSRGRRLAD